MGSKRLLLLGKQGLLLRLLLCLVLRLEVRGHRDGRQRWTRAPWPHLDGAGPRIVEAGPRAPSGSLLLLRRATRRSRALS